MVNVFVYGNWLNPNRMKQLFPDVQETDYNFDILEDYQLTFDVPHEVIFNARMLKSDFMNIRPSKGSMIAGFVISVPESQIKRCLAEKNYETLSVDLVSGKTALTFACRQNTVPFGYVWNAYVLNCLKGVDDIVLSSNRERNEYIKIIIEAQITYALRDKKIIY